MQKSDFLRTRVSQKLKNEFDEICQNSGKQPTGQLRELVEKFVMENYGKLRDRVLVNIFRPDGYDFGAWRVVVKLRDPSEMMIGCTPVPFSVPDLKGRIFIVDPEYRAMVNVPDAADPVFGGHFVDGEWRAHMYSNGFPEDKNPTPIPDVQQELSKSVGAIIERLRGYRLSSNHSNA